MKYNFDRTNHQIAANEHHVIYYGLNKQTMQPVAMKYYDYVMQDAQSAVRQMSILSRLNHPNLIRFHGIFESSMQTCIVEDLAKETLVQHIVNKKYYYEDECRLYIKQVVDALEYLHEYNIPFGNMKVGNVLVDNGTVKISDYAYKSMIPDEHNHVTMLFMSPEQITQEDYTLEPDIFALGVFAYFLIVGRLPMYIPLTSGNLVDAINKYLGSIL